MKYDSKTNRLINILLKKNIKLCAAESITGGRFAFEIIKNEDASKIFNYSLVTYTNESKSKILGLKKKINKTSNDIINKHTRNALLIIKITYWEWFADIKNSKKEESQKII